MDNELKKTPGSAGLGGLNLASRNPTLFSKYLALVFSGVLFNLED